MKLWSKLNKCVVEVAGVLNGRTLLCMTDDGRWINCCTEDLVKMIEAENMAITVRHIVNNPTFPIDTLVEITETDDDGTVHTLWNDYGHNFWSREIPEELLRKQITYMVVNSSTGILRLEVG